MVLKSTVKKLQKRRALSLIDDIFASPSTDSMRIFVQRFALGQLRCVVD